MKQFLSECWKRACESGATTSSRRKMVWKPANLQQTDAPNLAVLDWMMPGLDGVQLCREIRRRQAERYTYVVLLTGKNTKIDVVEGLDAGADDYVIKPYNAQELQVRLRTGKRILYLQEQLIAARNRSANGHARFAHGNMESRCGVRNSRQRIRPPEAARRIDCHCHGRSGSLQTNQRRIRPSNRRSNPAYHRGSHDTLHAPLRCRRPIRRRRVPGHPARLRQDECLEPCRTDRAAVSNLTVNVPGRFLTVTASVGVATVLAGSDIDSCLLIRAADTACIRAKTMAAIVLNTLNAKTWQPCRVAKAVVVSARRSSSCWTANLLERQAGAPRCLRCRRNSKLARRVFTHSFSHRSMLWYWNALKFDPKRMTSIPVPTSTTGAGFRNHPDDSKARIESLG